jgi:hypothetical protein
MATFAFKVLPLGHTVKPGLILLNDKSRFIFYFLQQIFKIYSMKLGQIKRAGILPARFTIFLWLNSARAYRSLTHSVSFPKFFSRRLNLKMLPALNPINIVRLLIAVRLNRHHTLRRLIF